MNHTMLRAAARAAFAGLALAFSIASLAATVYAQTNAADTNEVQIYQSTSDGTLALATQVATGGHGTGAGLGNQGALVLSEDQRWLFAVNAGSNDISSFAVADDGLLTLVDRVASGGTKPVSVTTRGGVLYALNAGGTGNIAGFAVEPNGRLAPIAGSSRPLSSNNAGAAQIGFDRGGEALVVTEKNTEKLDLYDVADGLARGPFVHASNGAEPFGFAFDRRGDLIVSEAAGGAANGSTVSSYDIDEPRTLAVISGSVPTHQTAACWIVIGGGGRFAYSTNTGSGTITGYRIARGGELAPLNADGVTGVTGGAPTDAAASPDGETIYVLVGSIGQIVAFHINSDGSVTRLGRTPGAPATATGLAAR
jgi:6-phosphogluconolactonase (cycloisomerase 2 family)